MVTAQSTGHLSVIQTSVRRSEVPMFPLLESLLIRNNKPANALYTNYSEFAHWNTPSLRHISAVHYFPLSLPNLENLTTLDITLILKSNRFCRRAQGTLKDESSRRTSALKLDNCSYPYVEPITIRNYKRTDLPSVRRLRIETELRKFDSGSSLLKRSLFSSLFFPGVIDLHVRLCGELPKLYPYSPNDSNSDTTLELAIEVMDIFRNIEQFLRVERFHLELHALCDALPNTAAWIGSQQGRISLFVPLNMLPSAKHISLQSNRSIVMPARNESKPEMRPSTSHTRDNHNHRKIRHMGCQALDQKYPWEAEEARGNGRRFVSSSSWPRTTMNLKRGHTRKGKHVADI